MLHNAHPKRNIGSAKRGEPSEDKSGKPINVVHMPSTFAPSLTAAIIFRRIGSHDRYRKRGLQTSFSNGRKKKTGQGSGLFSQKNARSEYKRLETTERLLYLFILPRNEGLPQKMQTKHTDTLN